jgi:hypothetical protein
MADRGIFTRNREAFDANEMAQGSAWSKALDRYRAKGMSEQEIDKYRTAYQQKMGMNRAAVQTLASRSKK